MIFEAHKQAIMTLEEKIYTQIFEATKPTELRPLVFSDFDEIEALSTAGIDNPVMRPIQFNGINFKSISLYSNDFNANVSFKNCKMEMFEIIACIFNGSITFDNCTFLGKVKFIDSIFNDIVRFHCCNFIHGINIFDKHDSYGSIEFKGGLYMF